MELMAFKSFRYSEMPPDLANKAYFESVLAVPGKGEPALAVYEVGALTRDFAAGLVQVSRRDKIDTADALDRWLMASGASAWEKVVIDYRWSEPTDAVHRAEAGFTSVTRPYAVRKVFIASKLPEGITQNMRKAYKETSWLEAVEEYCVGHFVQTLADRREEGPKELQRQILDDDAKKEPAHKALDDWLLSNGAGLNETIHILV